MPQITDKEEVKRQVDLGNLIAGAIQIVTFGTKDARAYDIDIVKRRVVQELNHQQLCELREVLDELAFKIFSGKAHAELQ